MPAKSRSQQRLFCMALAVRRGDLKRSEVQQSVLDIVDGDMTDKQIEDFTKMESYSHKSLSEYINESYKYTTKYAKGGLIFLDRLNNDVSNPDTLLVVIKPGFLKYTGYILKRYQKEGFKLYKLRTTVLSENEARRLYYPHRNEDFYYRLCKYMSSGESTAILLHFDGMDEKQAFKISDEIKDDVRKKYSESDMRNVMHSSDNAKNAKRESSVYFNEN